MGTNTSTAFLLLCFTPTTWCILTPHVAMGLSSWSEICIVRILEILVTLWRFKLFFHLSIYFNISFCPIYLIKFHTVKTWAIWSYRRTSLLGFNIEIYIGVLLTSQLFEIHSILVQNQFCLLGQIAKKTQQYINKSFSKTHHKLQIPYFINHVKDQSVTQYNYH